MASSLGAELYTGCPECAKMDMKLYHCPALVGRSRYYGTIPGLPHMHPQILSQSNNHCCPTTHQPGYPPVPFRLHSVCNCSRCRTSNLAMTTSHMPVNSCWVNPLEMTNSNLNSSFIPNPLPSRPCIPPRHVGMSPVPQMDSLSLDGVAGLSYHHHHHFHHYHYHTQSRNNLHPYALPVIHPRFRRRRSPRPSDESMLNPSFMPAVITSDASVTWESRLNTETLENLGQLATDEKPKGISKSILENLPTYKITSKDKDLSNTRCVICLMDFELKQQLRILPCLHEYHSKCIDKWLKNNRSCPICRKEIKLS